MYVDSTRPHSCLWWTESWKVQNGWRGGYVAN